MIDSGPITNASLEAASPIELRVARAEIPAFDNTRSLRAHRAEIMEAIGRVLDSGNLILGPEVSAFETEFASYIGSQFAVGMSSGTDALIAALRVLGVGVGDEVVTVANGPVPTVSAIRAVGAIPCFVDVSPTHLQMDPSKLARVISSRTKCVIPIHLYGSAAPIEAISSFCNERGLFLIEDCAQAHGTRFNERHVGTYGDISCFSFYPTKNLGALGDAGLCAANDAELDRRLREFRQYGFQSKDRIAFSEGMNCRLDELHAACLRVQLTHLNANLKQRRNIAIRYLEGLQGLPITLPSYPPECTPAWHQFVVRVRNRPEWMRYLNDRKIFPGIHYQRPIHQMPAFTCSGIVRDAMDNTELVCDEVISLPMFPELRTDEVDRVVVAMQEAIHSGLR
jgi:dTDP-4-amino-4,6-dideoxygalactose transaminase